ncbi:MAG TPA: methyltransferase domain-containing protein [Fimbriimonadaceae bacterium]|nr:methyltransferase domain-containing protein [Fimbriimonadaceae bacterium]
MLGPKERFSSRVGDYVKYRPMYPSEALALLERECGLTADWDVADVGAGPGNLSRLFLANGNRVYAVEPNREMREAGKALLGGDPNFVSVEGSAEETTLPAESVDLVVAGQAFHWFDAELAKREFLRILRPGGWAALVWNMRQTSESPFAQRYEAILRSIPEYAVVKADTAPIERLREFFAPAEMRQATLFNEQRLDLEAFLGRVLSSSYVPQAGQPGHEAIVEAMTRLFEDEGEDGQIRFLYDTQVFFGRLRG